MCVFFSPPLAEENKKKERVPMPVFFYTHDSRM